MSKFKFGENVRIEGTGLNCPGKVGLSGIVSDILGQPVGTIGLGGQFYNQQGEVAGTVKKNELPRMPTLSAIGTPTPNPVFTQPVVGERFESFEQKKFDDNTRMLKDIEGGYEWFKK